MQNRPIDIAVAKKELQRINDELSTPHLLIGGLAVQQYHLARHSKDIDLVCSFDTARQLLDILYPSRDWKVHDKQNDEYRPSFQIEHKVEEYGVIIFGPKISERKSYEYIEWERLKRDARPFNGPTGPLQNILVPSAHGLAYTKFISFLGRIAPEAKIRADLKDLVDLTNNENFSVSRFFDLLRSSRSFSDLSADFRSKVQNYKDVLEQSCLAALSPLFSVPSEDAVCSIPSANEALKAQTQYFVRSASEFIEAIGSDRVIELAPGTFNLSEVPDRYMTHVRWGAEFDGHTITIRDVRNLTIRGTDAAKVQLLVTPQYTHVLAFEGCADVQVHDLNMGHAPAGQCTGGVIAAADCDRLSISRCSLFGCGTEGLTLRGVKHLHISDSQIFGCTYGIASISSCKDLTFKSTEFRDNREFYGFNVHDCEGVEFVDSSVLRNVCQGAIFEVLSSAEVRFVRGRILRNSANGLGKIILVDSEVDRR